MIMQEMRDTGPVSAAESAGSARAAWANARRSRGLVQGEADWGRGEGRSHFLPAAGHHAENHRDP